MYSISRITEGIGIENRAECNHWAELSSAFATPLRISTTARRAVHTLIGSKEAFRTSTREFILKSKYNLASTILSKFAGWRSILLRCFELCYRWSNHSGRSEQFLLPSADDTP